MEVFASNKGNIGRGSFICETITFATRVLIWSKYIKMYVSKTTGTMLIYVYIYIERERENIYIYSKLLNDIRIYVCIYMHNEHIHIFIMYMYNIHI